MQVLSATPGMLYEGLSMEIFKKWAPSEKIEYAHTYTYMHIQVLFATPGMLHGGLSMEVFKKWAPSENNLVIMPGYCVAGTLGHKVLSNGGKPQTIELPKDEGGGQLHVRCKIRHLSFSAHADAKGIMTLIKQVQPVSLTHCNAIQRTVMHCNIPQHCAIFGACG